MQIRKVLNALINSELLWDVPNVQLQTAIFHKIPLPLRKNYKSFDI